MPYITKLSPQKRKKRVNVFIDQEFAFGVDLETLAKFNLQVGQEISEQRIEKIIKEGEFQKVYDKTLRFFSFRPRSEKEVKDWLAKKKIGVLVKKLVIKRLKKVKLLDDRKFALWWIDQRVAFKPKGRKLLEEELRKKGVSKEIIEQILETKITDGLELKLALKLVKKKLPSYQKMPYLKFRQKIADFLVQRGFSWEIIKKVIDEVLKKG